MRIRGGVEVDRGMEGEVYGPKGRPGERVGPKASRGALQRAIRQLEMNFIH